MFSATIALRIDTRYYPKYIYCYTPEKSKESLPDFELIESNYTMLGYVKTTRRVVYTFKRGPFLLRLPLPIHNIGIS